MLLKIFDIKAQCTGCGACVSVCPKMALTIDYNDEGFYSPHLNPELCIDCKCCEDVCQVLHMEIPKQPLRHYDAYMCKSRDRETVNKSSSGGMFSVLAEYVLNAGGVVFGARYNYGRERLEHCSTDDCSIDELRKSKYIESYIGDIFKQVGDNLTAGRITLFCGTPCQVAGLYSYLQKKKISTENLVSVRFVCHGVPSNKYFTEYKHFEEERYGAGMTRFDFRPKISGWASCEWLMEFANGKVSQGSYSHYYYYYTFQKGYFLRESCYQCEHLNHEIADFTIADFWGVIYYKPDLKEKDGLSLVLTHTPKANALLSEIKSKCEIELLPSSATDYIYNYAHEKLLLLERRNNMMKQVIKKGYMEVAKDSFGRQINKNNLIGFLRSIKTQIANK